MATEAVSDACSLRARIVQRMVRGLMNVVLSSATVCFVGAQTKIDLKTQTTNVDFTTAEWTAPIKVVAVLPQTCIVGHFVLIPTAASGENLFACIASNVWSLQGSVLRSESQPSGSSVATNTSVSVDGEAVLFSGTTGKTLKRATGTGPVKLTNGVLSTGNVILPTEVTGVLAVVNGGTGSTSSTGSGNVVLSNAPTIAMPTITSFVNATHNHASAAAGGQLTDAVFGSAISVGKGGTGATTLNGVLIGNGAAPVTGTSAVPVCTRYTIPYTAVQASAMTKSIPVFTLPARGKITGLTIKHTAAFGGSGLTGVSVSVGKGSDSIAYAEPYNVAQAVSDTAMQDDGGQYSVDFASHAVTAHFTSTGAELSALTAGSVDIWACTVVLP